MRHGKKGNHLGRKVGHRRALLANLAIALFTHKRINTTVAKAKALRVYAEPLITKAVKAGKAETVASSTHQHRVVFSYLQNKEAVHELFGDIAKKVGDRPGGYLRIIKLGFRKGDGAEMAMIELVDFNEVYNRKDDAGAEGATKRTRRGGKKVVSTGTAPVVAVAAPAVVAAAPVVEDVVIEREVVEAPAFETVVEAPAAFVAAAPAVIDTVVTTESFTTETTERIVETVVVTETIITEGIDQELVDAELDMSGWTVVSEPTDVDGPVSETEMERPEDEA